MEELLNNLIEKGWRPFGSYKDNITRYKYDNRFFEFNHEWDNMVTLRELVSKESWLWQFVCENGMVNKNKQYSFIKWSWKGRTDERSQKNYYYRLIESALCDEDKLEEFLLENIKVE